jgi:hypothetical protein
MAPGALGAGPEEGGGVRGPVDCAAREAAKKREASESEKRAATFRELKRLGKRWLLRREIACR